MKPRERVASAWPARVIGLRANSIDQRDCGEREQAGQHEEHIAPAEPVAEHAARRLSEQLSEHLTGQEAAQHALAVLVGDDVAEKGHPERDDPAGGKADQEPRNDELRQALRQAAQGNQDRRGRRRRGDAEIFTKPVADRPDDELHRAVRQRIGPDRDRGGADADVEIGGDLRQQRVRSPAPSTGWRSPQMRAARWRASRNGRWRWRAR